MIGFGPHLMIDGYGCNKEKLDSIEYVYNFLSSLPEKIGMTKIMEPYVFRYDSPDKPEDRGISGFVIVAESHVSIHTFPEKEYVSVDIFSCKEFDIEYATSFVTSYFDMKKYENNVTSRGTEFPRDITSVRNVVSTQRKRYE